MADSAQLDAVVVDLESEGRGVGYRQFVQVAIFEIDELVAAETDQVVVELEAGIVAGNPTGVAGLGDHSHAGEMLEGAVDSCARYSGEVDLDSIEYLVGGRMIVEVENRLEDHTALYRAAFAALATEPFEELDAFCPRRLVQTVAPLIPAIDDGGLDENMLH